MIGPRVRNSFYSQWNFPRQGRNSILSSGYGDHILWSIWRLGKIVRGLMSRGGNAEKLTFDWVIAPLKYGCEVV